MTPPCSFKHSLHSNHEGLAASLASNHPGLKSRLQGDPPPTPATPPRAAEQPGTAPGYLDGGLKLFSSHLGAPKRTRFNVKQKLWALAFSVGLAEDVVRFFSAGWTEMEQRGSIPLSHKSYHQTSPSIAGPENAFSHDTTSTPLLLATVICSHICRNLYVQKQTKICLLCLSKLLNL